MPRVLGCLFALLLLSQPAMAQDWPKKPIHIIASFAPGSTPDLMARLLGERLTQRLGQPVIVDNKPGAGGTLGHDAVAKAEPDGYTLGIANPGPLVVSALTGAALPYNPKTDFTPLSVLATQPSILAVSSSLGVSTLAELVALLKKNPGKYNYSSIGIGSISHLAMELVALQSGTEMVHVPYKSPPEAIQAVLAGDVQMACLPPIAVLPHVESGKLKALAVTTATRSDFAPTVPTFGQAGVPGIEAVAWMGLIAPAKLPRPIIDKIAAEIEAMMSAPEVREQLKKQFFQPVGISPAEFAAYLEIEEARWRPVVAAARIKP